MAGALKLKAAAYDENAIRAELRREMAAIHPDRNDGHFASPTDENRYHSLSDALNFLDQYQSTALVPLREIPAIVAAMRQALQPTTEATAAVARAEYRQGALSEAHTRYILPRIGSGVFAAVCASLIAFSGSLKDNPVFGAWLQSSVGRSMLLVFFLYSGLFFIMTWLLEQRESARVEWLVTEAGLRRTLSQVIERASLTSDRTLRFRFTDFCGVISGHREHGSRSSAYLPTVSTLFFLRRGLSPASAERLAKAQLEELERRGVVKKLAGQRLDITYEIERDVASELREHHGLT